MPTAAEPAVETVGRYRFDPASARSLYRREAAWALTAAGVAGATSLAGLGAAWPDISFALVLAAGLVAAFITRPGPALGVGGLVFAGTLLSGALLRGPSTLSVLLSSAGVGEGATSGLTALQVVVGGAMAGLGAVWLDGGPRERERLLQGALAGAASVGLGVVVATALVPETLLDTPRELLRGLVSGAIGAQCLAVAGLRYLSAQRIPSLAVIERSLQPLYRGVCLHARQLDQDLAQRAPDRDTRDGLGEVAAWIFRLQVTLQGLDVEIEGIDVQDLPARILRLTEEAAATTDEFTRDRKVATAGHLSQLQEHRAALVMERQRTQSLVDYASAYLEEARAGLALARVQPGDQSPARLDDVLGKLRTYARERDAHRRTARELGALRQSA